MNYLIPTEANPEIKADLDDQCLNMDYVMNAIEEAKNPLNIFVLDACRSNPFRGFYRTGEKGLSMVSTPQGSYIVYATKPGSVASDGSGRNGLFTSKLLKYIGEEGLNIEQVFKKVASDVASESKDSQRPWIASDFTGDFFFTPSKTYSTAEQVIFQENFNEKNPGWFTGSDAQYEISFYNGALLMHSKQGGSWFVNRNVDIDQSRDFEISVTSKKLSGTDDYYFGLILGENSNTGEFHFFGITGAGQVAFALHSTRNGEDFIPTDRRLAVNAGNASNRLRLRKEKGLMKLFVNDHEVASLPEKKFLGPLFGFRIWSGYSELRVTFDDLKFIYL